MINAAQKKVFEFFKEGPILIPDYQRQYSWGKEEILYQSGQMGQTVNLLAMPTVVRIHPCPH